MEQAGSDLYDLMTDRMLGGAPTNVHSKFSLKLNKTNIVTAHSTSFDFPQYKRNIVTVHSKSYVVSQYERIITCQI